MAPERLRAALKRFARVASKSTLPQFDETLLSYLIGQISYYSVSLKQLNSSLRCLLLEVAESSLIIIYEEQALDSHKENEARVGLKTQRSWVRYKKMLLIEGCALYIGWC